MAAIYVTGTTPEMMDSRDLIEWVAEYNENTENQSFASEPWEAVQEAINTRKAIRELELAGFEDWEYGATFIRDDYFKEYAQDLAADIGSIPEAGSSQWPLYCIDWEYAAKELQKDYTTAEFLGVTYWAR